MHWRREDSNLLLTMSGDGTVGVFILWGVRETPLTIRASLLMKHRVMENPLAAVWLPDTEEVQGQVTDPAGMGAAAKDDDKSDIMSLSQSFVMKVPPAPGEDIGLGCC